DWNMLCSYRFGTIIFPMSKEGSTPLPNVIAGKCFPDHFSVILLFLTVLSHSTVNDTDGDLDGDGKETLASQLVNFVVFRIRFLIPLLVV
ncbi:MAG: hypothetical protein RL059_1538, partial [Bacteroidota bacterium]